MVVMAVVEVDDCDNVGGNSGVSSDGGDCSSDGTYGRREIWSKMNLSKLQPSRLW